MTVQPKSDEFGDQYSDADFWAKLRRYARIAGREIVEKALLLYMVLRQPETPKWAKTAIIGALGYFIAPVDAIPDLLPGVGYTDDLGVLVMALTTVATLITPDLRRKARERVEAWFGADAGAPTEAPGTSDSTAGPRGRSSTGADAASGSEAASDAARAGGSLTAPEAP